MINLVTIDLLQILITDQNIIDEVIGYEQAVEDTH